MKGVLENDEDLFGTISWDGEKKEGVVAFILTLWKRTLYNS